MSVWQLWIGIILFGATLWLGFYLLGRDPHNWLSWLAGLSLLATAVSQILVVLEQYAPFIGLAQRMGRWQQLSLVLAVFFWLAFLVRLVPREQVWRERFTHTQPLMMILLTTTILFSLGTTAVLFPLGLSRFEALSGQALLLLVMGTAAAAIIAHEQGEALWPDLLRSFDYTFFTALLFGGQVALVMRFGTGVSFVMLALLYAVVATAVLVQAFALRLAGYLDQIALFNAPRIRLARGQHRASAAAVTRVNDGLDLLHLPVDEFERLTRRALSQMDNLPRLATSPLTYLPLVQARLRAQSLPLDTMGRATELKQALTESIERLKPQQAADFGHTNEWRHYNALYFPYVVGLRPYRRSVTVNGHSPEVKAALQWFRTEVPPRTLYNWQTAAAQLIARDLREQSRRVVAQQEKA